MMPNSVPSAKILPFSLKNSKQPNHNHKNNENQEDENDDDDDLLLAHDDIAKPKLNYHLTENNISSESKKNDKAHNNISNDNIFNKNSFFSLFDKKSNNNTNRVETIKKEQTSSNSNLLVDIGLFADLVETSHINNNNRNQKLRLKKNNNSKTKLINFDDDQMGGLENPNFESSSTHEDFNHSHGHSSIDQINNDLSLNNTNSNQNDVSQQHCHTLDDLMADKRRNATVWRKLIIVLVLCILFMIGEIVGGILAHSISIQTDAAHMASDIAGFFFSILAIYVSGKSPTRKMSFGYYRSEILGALFSTLIIWILTGILVYMAVMRLITKDFEIEPIAMVVTASCGVFFNIVMYFVLHTNKLFNGINVHGHSHSDGSHGHGHSHAKPTTIPFPNGHGHSHSHNHSHNNNNNNNNNTTNDHAHSHSINANQSDQVQIPIENCSEPEIVQSNDDSSNINLRAAAIHVIGDFIQSVGVLVAALIIYFKPDYKIADPICTFIFSVLVILTTAPIMKDIFLVLMEAVPNNINYDNVITDLCMIENVKKVHSLHIWCLTTEKMCLNVHLVTDKNLDNQRIIHEANNIIRSKYKIDRTTIQVETYDEIMDNCSKCKLPV